MTVKVMLDCDFEGCPERVQVDPPDGHDWVEIDDTDMFCLDDQWANAPDGWQVRGRAVGGVRCPQHAEVKQ